MDIMFQEVNNFQGQILSKIALRNRYISKLIFKSNGKKFYMK